jgi:hypothetical protein
MSKTFKWTVEIEVTENWVADGFNISPDRMHDIMCRALPYANGSEIGARVLKSPSPESIAIAQGDYKRLGWAFCRGDRMWHVIAELPATRNPEGTYTTTLCGISNRHGKPRERVPSGGMFCHDCDTRDRS